MKTYEYVIIGGGIAGCSTSFFLSKYSDSVLLIDRNNDLSQGASGAAGAFLSPLLGKANQFKDLVTKALNFSTNFYKENTPNEIINCGVVRIPKNNEDEKKFQSYKPYMDFEYKQEENGYFFKIGSQVNPYNICKILTKKVEKKFNYEVLSCEKKDGIWFLNNEIKAINLIICTGADTSLIKEKYFNIRAVWGQKIDISSTTCLTKNYHKSCSLSHSRKIEGEEIYLTSIGATHNRISCDLGVCNNLLGKDKLILNGFNSYTKELIQANTTELLEKANDIKLIQNPKIVDIKIGARASSIDYFPMVGKLIDSEKTLEKYPHLKNGSHMKNEMLSTIENLYVLNGVGGRGFVLSPYLAKNLVDHIIKNNFLEESISTHRLFKRWVKKIV
ncbi:D-amino-acid oxidase [Halarcobacter mediterraneus]|uniref:D-amino-acid oxidase n=1 Tax=Halarcobacter mediterraneus TaxID=2023153 RepID=A0A4Q1AZM8_9BACT|nr:FAD-dependent oxidoreductase [Halarcobacter mediterraneus]RXK14152.1 D-amino-acid oxidase [Halarcobacter mediterraneus]